MCSSYYTNSNTPCNFVKKIELVRSKTMPFEIGTIELSFFLYILENYFQNKKQLLPEDEI